MKLLTYEDGKNLRFTAPTAPTPFQSRSRRFGQVIRCMWDDRSSASQVVIAVSGLLAAALYVSQGILPYFIRDV